MFKVWIWTFTFLNSVTNREMGRGGGECYKGLTRNFTNFVNFFYNVVSCCFPTITFPLLAGKFQIGILNSSIKPNSIYVLKKDRDKWNWVWRILFLGLEQQYPECSNQGERKCKIKKTRMGSLGNKETWQPSVSI